MPASIESIDESSFTPPVRGFLHRSETSSDAALVLTHSAGSDCRSPLLRALAEAFCSAGITVLRCDLPFRQKRAHGAPFHSAEEDRAGLRNALSLLRRLAPGRLFLGGHSYGGRLASILAAEDPGNNRGSATLLALPDNENAKSAAPIADGLLLLSYPLHPPRQPAQLRTAHFPALRIPALFVHGARDPFGALPEMESAMAMIPAATRLLALQGAGHDLNFGRRAAGSPAAKDTSQAVLAAFQDFFIADRRSQSVS